MTIYLHRANNANVIEKAAAMHIGIELDIRTHNGLTFASHEPIISNNYDYLLLEDAIRLIESKQIPTLLDFKETGILDRVLCFCRNPNLYYGINLIFPDQLWAKKIGLKTLSRISSYEWIQETDGYMFDYMNKVTDLEDYKDDMCKKAIVVSPEIRGSFITERYVNVAKQKGFMGVVTDYPVDWL